MTASPAPISPINRLPKGWPGTRARLFQIAYRPVPVSVAPPTTLHATQSSCKGIVVVSSGLDSYHHIDAESQYDDYCPDKWQKYRFCEIYAMESILCRLGISTSLWLPLKRFRVLGRAERLCSYMEVLGEGLYSYFYYL